MSAETDDKPLRAGVEARAGYGVSPADIACVLDMDELRATYARELESSGFHVDLVREMEQKRMCPSSVSVFTRKK